MHGSASLTVIEPKSGWRSIDLREIREYRDLFRFLVLRNIKVLYKQTVMGFAWAVIRPLFSMLVFSFVFGKLARIPSDGVPYPVFSYAGLLPWTYFAASLSASTGSLIGSSRLISKVYFPRIIIPLTPVLSSLVDFGIASSVLVLLMAVFRIAPTFQALFLPVLVAVMMLTASGMGMWLSAMAVQYRDVRFATPFITQLLMYAAPVVWPLSLLAEKFPVWGPRIRILYGCYPMAGVIEGFRSALLGHTPMPWDLLGMGAVTAAILFVSGAFYFRKMERIFADVA
jgi:lipopolysaccharide transport system permease protein